MTSRTLFRLASLSLFSLLFSAAHPVFADASHARIIRLSLVQGDVRFASDVKGDPLADSNVGWQAAELNLPIRQGYVLATDKGRAEVEFENGAMAFLAENTVLEFYDLSLEDGAKTTRLVLRQGTASFYVNPADSDYFSVTGGDFTVESAGRASFRFDNLDDGSSVNVLKGHVSVLRKDKTTQLTKGQFFSMRAADDFSVSIGRLSNDDDFDRWVSGRIDSVVTATTAAQQYVSSPYYSSGLADLYTYGSWYPVAGYGNGWRPYGVGSGWSPFANGGWFTDPIFGSAFIGNQPWGWLPYHCGGWIFDPAYGWLWTSGGFGGGFCGGSSLSWVPVTGVWVHPKKHPGPVGLVPVHPLDVRGKTPINLPRGVFPVTGGSVSPRLAASTGEEWKVVKSAPRDTLSTTMIAAAPPMRVSRTVATNELAAHVVAVDHGSSITYDPREHRFVNTEAPPAAPAKTVDERTTAQGQTTMHVTGGVPAQRTSVPPASARSTVAYTPHVMTPPPPSRAAESARAATSGGSRFDSSRSSASHSSTTSTSHASSAPSSSGGHPH
jgi:FecR protein